MASGFDPTVNSKRQFGEVELRTVHSVSVPAVKNSTAAVISDSRWPLSSGLMVKQISDVFV